MSIRVRAHPSSVGNLLRLPPHSEQKPMSFLGPIRPGTLCPIPALSSSHSPPCSLTQSWLLEETLRHLMVPSQGLCTGGSLLPRAPHCFSLASPRHRLLSEALLLLALLHPILASFCLAPITGTPAMTLLSAIFLPPHVSATGWDLSDLSALKGHSGCPVALDHSGVGAIRSSRFPLRPPPWSPPSICLPHPMCSPSSPRDLCKMKTQPCPFPPTTLHGSLLSQMP